MRMINPQDPGGDTHERWCYMRCEDELYVKRWNGCVRNDPGLIKLRGCAD